jgi:hypothetical protein
MENVIRDAQPFSHVDTNVRRNVLLAQKTNIMANVIRNAQQFWNVATSVWGCVLLVQKMVSIWLA